MSKFEQVLHTQMSRRKFMKVSGLSLAGLAISAPLLSVMGCTKEEAASGAVTVWSTPQGLLVANMAKCTGCQRCEINCTLVNDGVASSYLSRVKVTRNLLGNNGHGIYEDDWVYYPDTCRQCAEPPCGKACPRGAIYASDSGVKIVDREKCIGCGACTQACPWHLPTVNPETGKSSKCILCGACAQGCPTGALSVVPWDRVRAAAQLARKQ
ncbi:MAG TPA: ferredoxin-like protein [Clostridia bacterium]|nr:ferredoxin-like protein [Clostridia bacterium]